MFACAKQEASAAAGDKILWAHSQNRHSFCHACAPSENSDQPAHWRRLIRIFTGRILDSKGCKVSPFGQQRHCVDERADLSLRFALMSEGTFSPVAAYTHVKI